MHEIDIFSSPIGLGHVTRDIAVVDEFQNMNSKFITGVGASKILEKLKMNVKNVYNPPEFNVESGKLKNSAKWLWRYYQYYKECKEISKKIIDEDKPELIISDEDFASISVAQENKITNVLITDILETKFTSGFSSIIEKKMNKSMKNMIEKSDLVIIPENGDNDGNIIRTGPIVRQTKFSREQLREKFFFDKKTVLIAIGGTSAGEFLIDRAIKEIGKINQDIEVCVVAGPALEKKFENIKNLGFVENLHEYIFASDVLISLAGKSTIDEAKCYGTPSIFIPIKDHFEQEDNAKQEGFVFEDINRLNELILEKLEDKRNARKTDGAKIAASNIEKLIKA